MFEAETERIIDGLLECEKKVKRSFKDRVKFLGLRYHENGVPFIETGKVWG